MIYNFMNKDKDKYNNILYTRNSKVIDTLNIFYDDFLGYKKNTHRIFISSDNYKDIIILQLHSILINIFLDNKNGFDNAKNKLNKCKNLIRNGSATDREIKYYDFLKKLMNKEFFKALNILNKLIIDNPTDLFTAKLGQIFYFSIGEIGKMLELSNFIIEHNSDNHLALSMLSFALEENNYIDKAKNNAIKSIEIEPSDPWAHHTLAHIYEVENNPVKGIEVLNKYRHYWEKCNSFIYTHNWWHISLFYLKQKNIDKVKKIFNRHLWDSPNSNKQFSQDQAGAISLLIRLKLLNVDVSEEWDNVCSEICKRDTFYSDPFVSSHFSYAIGSMNNKILKKKFIENLNLLNISNNYYDIQIWKKAGVPICYGMMCHAEKDYEKSFKYFNQSKDYWHLVGGSHTQRNLYEILYRDAIIKKN